MRASQILPWSLCPTFLWIYYCYTLWLILASNSYSWFSYLIFKSAAAPAKPRDVTLFENLQKMVRLRNVAG